MGGYLDQLLTDLLLHHNKSVANITFYGECNLTFLKRHWHGSTTCSQLSEEDTDKVDHQQCYLTFLKETLSRFNTINVPSPFWRRHWPTPTMSSHLSKRDTDKVEHHMLSPFWRRHWQGWTGGPQAPLRLTVHAHAAMPTGVSAVWCQDPVELPLKVPKEAKVEHWFYTDCEIKIVDKLFHMTCNTTAKWRSVADRISLSLTCSHTHTVHTVHAHTRAHTHTHIHSTPCKPP